MVAIIVIVVRENLSSMCQKGIDFSALKCRYYPEGLWTITFLISAGLHVKPKLSKIHNSSFLTESWILCKVKSGNSIINRKLHDENLVRVN